jgi:NAD(P)H-hydrate epimerase
MYLAAKGVYDSYEGWKGKSIAIAVGGGNNGGDGYALAGILKKNGYDPVIYKVSDKMSDDGRYYFDIATELGVQVIDFDEATDLASYDVIVDCILGTGFKGEVRGRAGVAITEINNSTAYVISVDINSGMNGDTGEAELAVRSDLTVSIGYYKQGLFRGNAGEYIGRLTNVDIGIKLIDENGEEYQ